MTVRFLHNFPARNALRVVSQNRKFAIVTCILQLLGIPLIMGSLMLEAYNENATEHYVGSNVWAYASIGLFCATVSVMLGIFFGIHAYREEWDKSKVDMLYSLPLTGRQRFFSNYLGGLGMYVIPYIVACLIGWIVMLAFTPLVRSVMDTTEEINSISLLYRYYFLITFGLLLLMWMYYTISVLITSCCGTLFENIYTNVLLNLLIPGTLAILLAVICFNVNAISFEYSWDVIGHTSPIGGAIYLLYLLATKMETLSEYFMSDYYTSTYTATAGELGDLGLAPAYIRWALIIILLTTAILILAWRLYEHRKAELVGKPFIYLGIYYIILTAIAVCILCITQASSETLIPVLIFSMIVYFIMEVIRKRGFKKFWMSAISYVITVVVTLGGLQIVSVTDAFGRANYIPALASVTSVKVELSEPDNRYYPEYELNFNDKDTISKIRDFHKLCNTHRKDNYTKQIEEHLDGYYTLYLHDISDDDTNTPDTEIYDDKEYIQNSFKQYEFRTSDQDATESYDYEYEDYYSARIYRRLAADYEACSTVGLTYYTITGSAIHREYRLLPDEYLQILEICMQTDTYVEAMGNLLKCRLDRTYKESQYIDTKTIRTYPAQTTFFVNPPLNQQSYRQYSSSSDFSQKFTINNVATKMYALRTAYENDLRNSTPEQLRTDEIICYVCALPVYSCYTETCALLKDWGMKEFSLGDNYADLQNTYYTSDTSALYIRIYAPGTYTSLSLDYAVNTFDSFRFKPDSAGSDIPCYESMYFYTDNFGGYLRSYNSALYDLLKVARTQYISNDPCYVLVINSNRYVIPAEYADLVQKVIAKGNVDFSSTSGSAGSVQDYRKSSPGSGRTVNF